MAFSITSFASETPNRQAVKCVQEQAKIIGEDPGPVDGIWGPKTQSALYNVGKLPKYSSIPKPRGSNSVVLCGLLADLDARLVAATPAAHQPVRISFHPHLYFATRTHLDSSIEKTFTELRRSIGKRMPLRLDFIVSHNTYDIERVVQIAIGRNYNSKDIRKVVTKRCKGVDLAGFMFPELIVICGNVFAPHRTNAGVPWDRVKLTIAHEIVHHFQYQMSGASGVRRGEHDTIPGPLWLIEGTAVVMADKFLTNASLEEIEDRLIRVNNANLNKLNMYIKDNDITSGAYATYALATLRLLRNKPTNSALDYFSLRGQGLSHDDAFRDAFGKTESDFLAQFK